MVAMTGQIKFEELSKEERILLLRAFDYDVDSEGYVLSPTGDRIPSNEIPSAFLRVEDSMLIPSSLEVVDGTPSAISKFIRERVTTGDPTC
jgi:hypothetical protein